MNLNYRKDWIKNEILVQSIDFVNKMKYNEYTNIDKLIYQIN